MKKKQMNKLMLNRKKISKLITRKIQGGTDVGSATFGIQNPPGVADTNESVCVDNCTQTVLNCQ